MPVYDYKCLDCNKDFTLVLKVAEHEKRKVACPKCKSKNVKQIPSAFYAVTSKKS